MFTVKGYDEDDEDEEEEEVEEEEDDYAEKKEDKLSSTSNINEHKIIPYGVENTFDIYALERKIPVSHQVELKGHAKAVTTISLEPAGNRLVTGSLDYSTKLFDFGGMDARHKAFHSIEAHESHPVSAVSHSPSGDKFIVGTGSTQPVIFDREGKEIIKFVRGDMYIRDLTNTKGHTMEVTGVTWHPVEKNIVLTSSLDGSVRVWDLLGVALFGNLTNKHVLKIRGITGQNRCGATSCCYSPNGQKSIGGAVDGSIHIWNMTKKVFSKADVILRLEDFDASSKGPNSVTSVVVSPTNANLLAARYEKGQIAIWDMSTPKAAPVKVIFNMLNEYPTANIDFSPDGSLLCCGNSAVGQKDTSPSAAAPDNKAGIYFFEVSGANASPCMHVTVATNCSVIIVKWQPNTNQLCCGLSNGVVKILFDPRMSKKGALLSAAKAPRRDADAADFAASSVVGEIVNPLALPMYRNDHSNPRKRAMEKKDPIRNKIPEKPIKQGPGSRENTSFFFTNYVMSGRTTDSALKEDPREALIKLDEASKKDPLYLGKAYQDNQPKVLLHSVTAEEEQEEFKKKQKRLL